MEFMVLAHPDDELALRVAARLRRVHGSQAVGIVAAEALAMAENVIYHQTPTPPDPLLKIEYEWRLASGAKIRSGELRSVFNRLRLVSAPQFATADAADRDYAAVELGALWVSWLSALQRERVLVVNPPERGSLQLAYSRLEWFKIAWQAGFAVPRVALESIEDEIPSVNSPRQRWLAAGNQLVPAGKQPPASSAEIAGDFPYRLRALQKNSGCSLIELVISEVDGVLLEVNPFPQSNHPNAVDAIVTLLEAGAR
jgi:hypothetical protein